MDLNSRVELGTQIDIMCSAIQHVFYDNGIFLEQMRKKDTKEHLIAVGDTVITIGSTPIDFSLWRKAVNLDAEVSARIAEFFGFRGLHLREISVTLYPYNNMILAEISRPVPNLVTWSEVEKDAGELILIGRDKRRKPIFLDLEKSVPGILVTGASGMGKTNIMRLIAAQAFHHNVDIYIACLKGPRDWRDLFHIAKRTAFDNESGFILLQEVLRRLQLRNTDKESIDTPILLIWDEIAYPVTDKDNQELLGTLARTCRSSNIILVAGTQTADKNIHLDIKNNLRDRFAFKARDSQMSFMNTGITKLGAEKLNPFEMIGVLDNYPDRISTPRADEKDIQTLLLPRINSRDKYETVKTLNEILISFNNDDLAVDKRRTPLVREAAWVAVFYWRRGRLPTNYELNKIVRTRSKLSSIPQSKIDRIQKFIDNYYTKEIQNYDFEIKMVIGGSFSPNFVPLYQGEVSPEYLSRWEVIRIGRGQSET
jgi:hypothetical protein